MPNVVPQSAPVQQSPVAPVVEAAPIAVAPEAPKEELLSPKFAALARQTKELRRQQVALKAEEAALKARSAQYESDYIPKSKLLEDPISILQANGITYDQIVQRVIDSQTPEDPRYKSLTSEFKALKDTTEKMKEEQAQRQTREYDQAVNQIRNETKLIVESNEAFETIKEAGQSEAVVELIKKHFEQKGIVLAIEEAATQVENYLLEESIKVANYKKVKAKLQPVEVVPDAIAPMATTPSLSGRPRITPKQIIETPQLKLKTLTHAQTASPSAKLSERDRVQRAILAFKGQLT